jgi:Na+/H+-dicarboxylate symporter
VILSAILTYIIKLPAEGYALVLGITAVIYQIESTVNITGTEAVSYIVASSEGALSKVKLKDFF